MDRIQLRRDTSNNWKVTNPILLEGEVGYEIDTKLRKIGDGVNHWNDLDYLKLEDITNELGNSTSLAVSQDLFTKLHNEGYKFAGIADLNTIPQNVTNDSKIYYITNTPGSYTNFNNIVVSDGEIAFLTYNGSWSKVVLEDVASRSSVDELKSEVMRYGAIPFQFNVVGGLNTNGSESPNEAFVRTPFVPVKEGDVITYNIKEGSAGWAALAAYDSNKSYLAELSIIGTGQPQDGKYVVPSTVAYIKLASLKSYVDTFAKSLFTADEVKHVTVGNEQIEDSSVSMNKLDKDVDSFFNRIISFNKIGGVGYTDGLITESEFSEKYMTGYIRVYEGEEITFDVIAGSTGWAALAAFNDKFEYIKEKSIAGMSGIDMPIKDTYIVPSGVAYVVLTGIQTYQNSAKLRSIENRELTRELEKDVINKLNEFSGNIPFDIVGSWNYADNTDSPHEGFVRTKYIAVKEGDIINCSLAPASLAWGLVGFYNAEMQYLKDLSYNGIPSAPTEIKVVIPTGVAYVRFSSQKDFEYFATLNKIVRENDVLHENANIITCDKIVNLHSLMRYPNILEKRGCLAMQMDLGNLDDSYSGHKSMLKVLREYGLMSMDYAINITALSHEDISWLNVAQMEGCEIIYHNRINSPSDFSSESTLTEDEVKVGVTNERKRMAQQGFTTFGFVANVGTVADRFKPMLNNLFAWGEYGSAMILTNGAETTKEQYLSNQRIVRTSFDMTYDVYNIEKEQEMIDKGKVWIDSICANQSMGVLYCHFFNTFVDDYHLYESVLRAMCEYIVEKINNGELYYGATTECLNYLLSK